jgi:hypothetical protein
MANLGKKLSNFQAWMEEGDNDKHHLPHSMLGILNHLGDLEIFWVILNNFVHGGRGAMLGITPKGEAILGINVGGEVILGITIGVERNDGHFTPSPPHICP